jgi:hypothetical protein
MSPSDLVSILIIPRSTMDFQHLLSKPKRLLGEIADLILVFCNESRELLDAFFYVITHSHFQAMNLLVPKAFSIQP